MRKKHKFLKIAILSLMVLFSSYLSSHTFAYWSNTSLFDAQQENVTIGEWNQIFEWNPDRTYLRGDQIIYNGVIYTAKRDNPTRQPGVDNGWKSDWQ